MISFNAAISACEKGKQREQAFVLFHKMRKTGMTANVISFNTVNGNSRKMGTNFRLLEYFERPCVWAVVLARLPT